jgi:hypothetical protein
MSEADRLYRTDFRLWARQQADAIRPGRDEALDREHLAEEVEDLWKPAAHALAMLLHTCIELCYGGERHEAYLYCWQSAAFDHHQAMLVSAVKDSPSLHTMLAGLVPEVYAEERAERRAKALPPLTSDPPEACPRTLAQLLDGQFWPPQAPPRLP